MRLSQMQQGLRRGWADSPENDFGLHVRPASCATAYVATTTANAQQGMVKQIHARLLPRKRNEKPVGIRLLFNSDHNR
jgi:hypothetical protein